MYSSADREFIQRDPKAGNVCEIGAIEIVTPPNSVDIK